jgi:hypothetical protein
VVQEDSDEEEAVIPRPIQVKREKLSTEKEKAVQDDNNEPAKRTTRTKSSKETLPAQVKVSKSDVAARDTDSESEGGKKNTGKAKKQQATSPARSEKSVYEDAVSEVGLRPAVVLCQKIQMAAGTPPSKGDETFVQQPGSANATYNVNQGNDTYEKPAHANETFDVINAGPSPQMDGTFVMEKNSVAVVNKSNDKKGPPDTYNETLMTEDNSQDEDDEVCLADLKKKQVPATKSTAGPKSSKVGKNELFK